MTLCGLLPVIAAEAHKHPTWADFGPVEWVALVVAQVIAIITVWKAVMYTLRPGETEPDHIKRIIFSEDDAAVDPAIQAWIIQHHGAPAVPPTRGARDE